MTDYRGIIPFIVETAKDKGMRFDISDFSDGDIECLNEDVVIFRGKANDLIHRLFEGSE